MIWGVEGRHLWLPYDASYPITDPGWLAAKLAAGVSLPSDLTIQSNFLTESGDISGDALALGGNWTIVGSHATHLSAAAGVLTRSVVSENDNYLSGAIDGSGGIATPSIASTGFIARLRFRRSADPTAANSAHNVRQGILFNWGSSTAWMLVNLKVGSVAYAGGPNSSSISITKGGFGAVGSAIPAFSTLPNVDYQLVFWHSGTSYAIFFGRDDGSPLALMGQGTATFAPTSGPVGLWDMCSAPDAITRTYNSFEVWATGALPTITLNRRVDDAGAAAFPNYWVKKIGGLMSTGESQDARQNRVGAQGEIPRRSYRRGKTITYEGNIKALSRSSLRQAEADLRAAFDDQTKESLVVVTPHPLYDASGHYRYFSARALTAEVADEIAVSPRRATRGHESGFVVALRNSRAGGVSYYDQAGVGYP